MKGMLRAKWTLSNMIALYETLKIITNKYEKFFILIFSFIPAFIFMGAIRTSVAESIGKSEGPSKSRHTKRLNITIF